MIDYPRFRARGYPIGSGSVESSHKHVVHSRLKQAGMRWSEQHVNPMLALRNLIANDRWEEGWSQLTSFRLQKRWALQSQAKPRPVPPPLTFDSVRVAPEPTISPDSTSDGSVPKKRWRPPPDHPWRRPWLPSRS